MTIPLARWLRPVSAVRWFMALLLATSFNVRARDLKPNDIIAWLGGSDVVAAQESGHFETLLRVAHPTVRIRSLAWEADTVFAQPRDFKFPSITTQLENAKATMVFCQFGQGEALRGTNELGPFLDAYRKLIREVGQNRRVALITPRPFEPANPPLPDLSRKNPDLEIYAAAIRKLAREEKADLIDLHEAMAHSLESFRLTSDGWHLTPRGHTTAAVAMARAIGFGETANRAGPSDGKGRWANPTFEALRQTIIEKNRLWFDYSRPTNWAFLGGDRVEQPSSRDHLNPAIRWFPAEMQKFIPLIEQTESRIEQQAREAK